MVDWLFEIADATLAELSSAICHEAERDLTLDDHPVQVQVQRFRSDLSRCRQKLATS